MAGSVIDAEMSAAEARTDGGEAFPPLDFIFKDRVLSVGRVRSCCSYQGGDRFWAQLCTVDSPMRSNWLGGPGGSALIGGTRVNLK